MSFNWFWAVVVVLLIAGIVALALTSFFLRPSQKPGRRGRRGVAGGTGATGAAGAGATGGSGPSSSTLVLSFSPTAGFNYLVPGDGVRSVTARLWAGGNGGMDGSSVATGSGGGGGAYLETSLLATGGVTVLTLNVGAGGLPGNEGGPTNLMLPDGSTWQAPPALGPNGFPPVFLSPNYAPGGVTWTAVGFAGGTAGTPNGGGAYPNQAGGAASSPGEFPGGGGGGGDPNEPGGAGADGLLILQIS